MPNKYLLKKSKELQKHITERGNRLYIAVDLDDTLTHFEGWKGYDYIGKPRKEIIDLIRKAKKIKNAYIIVYTCRISDVKQRILSGSVKIVKQWLEKFKIPYDDIWTRRGKPFANLYIDDGGKNPNCKECLKNIGEFLK